MKNNVLPDGELGEGGPGAGVLYRVAPDGGVTEWRKGLGIANTLCWSPDGRSFYFADTLANEIYAYDYADGTIANERRSLRASIAARPTARRSTARAILWNCRFGGGCIVRLAPDGAVDRVVEMPVRNITTCTFGGPDLRTLFITTASIVAPPGDRLAGSLFALDVDVPGVPENRFSIS